MIEKNQKLEDDVCKLRGELETANEKINVLENYAHNDNLIISGLPSVDYSDAASANTTRDATESSQSTERAVLEFVNNTLNVPTKSNDISIAHRLKRTTATGQNPPNIMVRFANRKIRNDVYAAQRQLRTTSLRPGNPNQAIYINEDLTKENVQIFKQARATVRQKTLHKCWTNDGFVFVKKSATSHTKVKIFKIADLMKL